MPGLVVLGNKNPADFLSRGVSVEILLNGDLWWKGPQFLREVDFPTDTDDSGIFRVGGRLKYSDLSLDEKHPIVLPDKHPLTLIIVSRRGKSSKIFRNNAKNFVGASTEWKKFNKMVSHPNETLANFLLCENIEWKFIAPKSPNFGGLWEAGIKSFKHHLKRVVGNAHLTLKEFLTIILEIESVLNSRPLTPLLTEFDNFEILSPGHFLIGRSLTSIVEPGLLNISETF
ncbi:hypothetical protein AVEN_34883-1 [Araneus ventricosus]|uniref:Integrase catalytic domain-containing protein n=1 Tax=Araneus ventricosus TaxID=182803 RepID=A0A4Y2ILF0_ARAVE|nr:hypothetical protein AVEN_34883-1 [Araneus ventricosus]